MRYTVFEENFEERMISMIKVTVTNDILKKISSIDENRFSLSMIDLDSLFPAHGRVVFEKSL